MPTTIEKARLMMGLSQPQMLAAIGAKPWRLTLLAAHDDAGIDPVYIDRSIELLDAYKNWKQSILDAVDAKQELTVGEFAELLGCTRYLLYQMHSRGVFTPPHVEDSRYFVITPDFVRSMFELNEALADRPVITGIDGHQHRLVRGPFADFFLKAIGFDYTPPQRQRRQEQRKQEQSDGEADRPEADTDPTQTVVEQSSV